jgi:rhomboid family protein
MVPIRDSASRRRFTPVNTFLIAANVLVFVYEVQLGRGAATFLREFGLIPIRLTHFSSALAWSVDPSAPVTLLTSIFLHAGVAHVLGNMLYLYIFGPAVEQSLGWVRFLFFYLVSGIAAGLASVWMAPMSHVPVIGASGAIAGVLGAYFMLYPRGRILTVLPVFVFVQIIEIPALVYLLVWFAVQLWGGIQAQEAAGMAGGVAWWAHIGGFLFGVALAPVVARTRVKRSPLW